jgi:hypothetical protein
MWAGEARENPDREAPPDERQTGRVTASARACPAGSLALVQISALSRENAPSHSRLPPSGRQCVYSRWRPGHARIRATSTPCSPDTTSFRSIPATEGWSSLAGERAARVGLRRRRGRMTPKKSKRLGGCSSGLC